MDDEVVAGLVGFLPEVVANAVACRAEPYDGNIKPGDIILRLFRATADDIFDLDVLIEIKSKWFKDRAANRQDRSDTICEQIQIVFDIERIGVYLDLPVASWSESEACSA